MRNPYILAGTVLLIVGLYFTTFSYFALSSAPLTAVGLSTAVIGFTSIGLANTRPKISQEACQIILTSGVENMTKFLETLGLKSKAIYVPPNMQGANSRALIPVTEEASRQMIKALPTGIMILRGVRTREDVAIAVTTPGNLCLNFLKSKPGASEDEIKSAVNYVLTRVLDIATAVNVRFSNSRINVEVKGSEIAFEDNLFYRSVGSPIASITAAICSHALDRSIAVVEENNNNRKTKIVLEVLS